MNQGEETNMRIPKRGELVEITMLMEVTSQDVVNSKAKVGDGAFVREMDPIVVLDGKVTLNEHGDWVRVFGIPASVATLFHPVKPVKDGERNLA